MRVVRTLVLGAGLSIYASLARAAPPTEVQTPAPAPAPTTAGEWYARGYDLANAKQYEAAADAFLRSYELKPTSEALFNAALALENGGDTLASIETYERVLLEPSIDPKLADQARSSIDALARTVGTIKDVRYSPSRPPATIYIRGEAIELDEFPRRVLPGTIEVEAVDEAGVRVAETYVLSAGETLILDLRALLPRLPDPEPPAPVVIRDEPEPEPEIDVESLARRAASLRRVTWIGLGLTGAGVAATASLGIATAIEHGRYDTDTCLEYPDQMCPEGFVPGDPESHLRLGSGLRLATWAAAGVTGGFALATLVVGALSVRYQRRSKAARARVGPSPSGLALAF